MTDLPLNRFGEPTKQEDYGWAPEEELEFDEKEAWAACRAEGAI